MPAYNGGMIQLDRGILDDILAHSDRDDLRLLAADWFEDQGEVERAEFVRVQVQMEHTTVCPCDPHGTLPDGWSRLWTPQTRLCPCRWCGLRRQEQQFLCAHHAPTGYSCWWGWADEALQKCHDESECTKEPDPADWTFRRGFVHAITCTAADWLAHADAIRAQNPVQAVTLTTWPEMAVWYEEDESPGSRKAMLRQLKRQWPGITFTLPDGTIGAEDVYDMITRLEQARVDRLILEGDPEAARPLGILNAPKQKQPALDDPRPAKPPRKR